MSSINIIKALSTALRSLATSGIEKSWEWRETSLAQLGATRASYSRHIRSNFVSEMLFFYHLHEEEESFVAFYPQIHIKFSHKLKIQIGIGIFCHKSKVVPQFAHKVIVAAPKAPEVEEPWTGNWAAKDLPATKLVDWFQFCNDVIVVLLACPLFTLVKCCLTWNYQASVHCSKQRHQ